MKRRLIASLAAAVIGLSSTGTALAGSETLRVPESSTRVNPCTGATVVLSGTKHVVVTTQTNPDGSRTVSWTRSHVNTHLDGSVVLPGADDLIGTKYVANDQTTDTQKQFPNGAEIILDTVAHVISAGKSDNWTIITYIKVSTVPGAEPVVVNTDSRCNG
jgi:hypothetical protein